MMPTAIIVRSASPPMTPPTIGPTGIEFLITGGGGGDGFVVTGDRLVV